MMMMLMRWDFPTTGEGYDDAVLLRGGQQGHLRCHPQGEILRALREAVDDERECSRGGAQRARSGSDEVESSTETKPFVPLITLRSLIAVCETAA